MAEYGGIGQHGGRLAISPTLTDDHAVELWARTGSTVTDARVSAVCVWLDPADLRRVAADLIARADLIDPPATPEGA